MFLRKHVWMGFIVTGMLSACGGGAEDSGNQQSFTPEIISSYIGTYSNNHCWSDIPDADPYSAMTEQIVISASDKPNTLNIASTYFYYQSDDKGNRCGVKIGSSTAYGEMTYMGSLSSVEFTYITRLPMDADKFEINFNNVVNEGIYGEGFDEVSDYVSGTRGLFARNGNILYTADFDSPRDSDNFPTKLYDYRYTIGRTDNPGNHQLSDYEGTFTDMVCAVPEQLLGPYAGVTSYIVFTPSNKSNTLTVEHKRIYYQYDADAFVDDKRCGVQIGFSTAYGEMTYLGSLPSVEFSNLTNLPMAADKFETTISEVINQGVFDSKWDEISDYSNFSKTLFALDGKVVYAASFTSLKDADGFPTQLDQYTFGIRQ